MFRILFSRAAQYELLTVVSSLTELMIILLGRLLYRFNSLYAPCLASADQLRGLKRCHLALRAAVLADFWKQSQAFDIVFIAILDISTIGSKHAFSIFGIAPALCAALLPTLPQRGSESRRCFRHCVLDDAHIAPES